MEGDDRWWSEMAHPYFSNLIKAFVRFIINRNINFGQGMLVLYDDVVMCFSLTLFVLSRGCRMSETRPARHRLHLPSRATGCTCHRAPSLAA